MFILLAICVALGFLKASGDCLYCCLHASAFCVFINMYRYMLAAC